MNDARKTPGLYRFDEADAELSLLPMAARRALDCVGLHLSLSGWQKLTLAERQTLTQLGAADVVDTARIGRVLAERSSDIRPAPPLTEADASLGPSPELVQALPAMQSMSHERWGQLSALDRYVLSQLAPRGKLERLMQAYAEICGQP